MERIRRILSEARARTLQAVNAAMIAACWHIGREIVEEEQRGQRRAKYGAQLIQHLSKQLTIEFGRGFSQRNLETIRQFYLTYANRHPEIPHTVCAESQPTRSRPFYPELSWSHYRLLVRVSNEKARHFYEVESAKARWSVRVLAHLGGIEHLAGARVGRIRRTLSRDRVRALQVANAAMIPTRRRALRESVEERWRTQFSTRRVEK